MPAASSSKKSTVRVRFAPSPTGFLHVGGARTALFNWIYARKNGGQFVLRVEDTDEKRNTPEARQAIYDGLHWLGLDWDEGPEKGGDYGPYFQSQRMEIYEKHLATLEKKKMLYKEDDGAVRFKSPRKDVVVNDLICGDITFDRTAEPDMTIRRANGSFIFHFVNVVDDLEMGITHVIRGEDHLSNTPKHLELFQALGEKPPQYAHIPLILNQDGSKMSKRDQGAAVHFYQENGYAPEAVRNYLCLLGWSPKDNREILEIEEVVRLFTFENVNRRNARFDLEKCFWLNGQYILSMSVERFRELSEPFMDRAEIGYRDFDDDYVNGVLSIVKEKVKHLNDVPEWVSYFFTDDFEFEDKAVKKRLSKQETFDYLQTLVAKLSRKRKWEAADLKITVETTAEELGVKIGELINPVRIAVSGKQVGPGMFEMLEVMGKDRVIARLKAAETKFRGDAE